MDDEQFWQEKIIAYLHDPPFKPWHLPYHQRNAAEIATSAFGEKIETKDLRADKRPDWIASAAERLHFPWGIRASFASFPALVHVLSGRRLSIDEGGILDIGANKEQWKEFKKAISEEDSASVLQRAKTACLHRVEKYRQEAPAGDPRSLFFRLWRSLAFDLENHPDPFGILWRFMPADTRIPDHSVWDHVRLSSAIAGCLAHEDRMAFLHFKVGPVQSFITESRKARDLWAASYIISMLSGCAMATIATEVGPDAILHPDLSGCAEADWLLWLKLGKKDDWLKKFWELPEAGWPLTTASLPASFVALVPAFQARSLAEKARDMASGTWRMIASGVREEIRPKNKKQQWGHWDEGWDQQIDNVFQFRFAILPWPETPEKLKNGKDKVRQSLKALELRLNDDSLPESIWVESYGSGSEIGPNAGNLYGAMHAALSQRAEARGQVYCFSFHQGDNREKCTLCGRREAMGPQGALRGFWDDLQKRPANRVILKPAGAERLCAPCAIKRFCWQAGLKSKLNVFSSKAELSHISLFPSTATIAAVPFLHRLGELFFDSGSEEIQKAAIAHLQAVQKLMAKALDKQWNPGRPAVKCLATLAEKLSDGEIAQVLALDGEFFLPERFTPETVKLEYGPGLDGETAECAASLDALQKALRKGGEPFRPPSYLSLLAFDGDEVGEWIAGRKAPKLGEVIHPDISGDEFVKKFNPNGKRKGDPSTLLEQRRPNCPALQAAISRALRDFSQYAAREAVEEHGLGRLVYAGGGELLAFAPTCTTLPLLRRLRAYYSGAMVRKNGTWEPDLHVLDDSEELLERPLQLPRALSDSPAATPLATMGLKATASGAAVFFHCLSSLEAAITTLRKTLARAKRFPEKNVFALAILKRSGEPISLVLPWRIPIQKAGERSLDVIREILDPLVNNMAAGRISRNLVYHLAKEAEAVAPDGAARDHFETWLAWHLGRHASDLQGLDLLASGLVRLAMKAALTGDSGPGKCLLDILGAARFLAGASAKGGFEDA